MVARVTPLHHAKHGSGHDPPTLVIWGKQGEVIPDLHSQNLPVAQVVFFDDAGHMVYVDKTSDLNALIKQHIGG